MGDFLDEALGNNTVKREAIKPPKSEAVVGESVPKKIMAVEVLKQVKLNIITEYIGLGTIFLILILSTLNRMYGVYVAVLGIVPLVFFLAKDTKQKVFITKKYFGGAQDKGGAI